MFLQTNVMFMHILLVSFVWLIVAIKIIIIQIFTFFQILPNFGYGEVNKMLKQSAVLPNSGSSTRYGTHNILSYKSIVIISILHVTDADVARDLKNTIMKRKQQWERTKSSSSIKSQQNTNKKFKLMKKVENPTISSIQKNVIEIIEPCWPTVNVISNHVVRCPKFSTTDQGIYPKIKSPIVMTQNVNTNTALPELYTPMPKKDIPTENTDETKATKTQESVTFEIPAPISKMVSLTYFEVVNVSLYLSVDNKHLFY